MGCSLDIYMRLDAAPWEDFPYILELLMRERFYNIWRHPVATHAGTFTLLRNYAIQVFKHSVST